MSKEKHTLNDIIKKFQDIEVLFLESEGELTDEIENILLDNEADLSLKLDGYEKFSRYFVQINVEHHIFQTRYKHQYSTE